ncbi:MAG: hypothetical protein V1763_03245 [Parcubacteria group bacterium]
MLTRIHQFTDNLRSTPGRKNKFMLISTAIGVLANLGAWILILIRLRPILSSLPPDQSFIPLHYNIYFGVDLFGQWQRIFIMPGIGLAILIINAILALSLFNKKKMLAYLLTGIAGAIQIFVLIATVLVILINI